MKFKEIMNGRKMSIGMALVAGVVMFNAQRYFSELVPYIRRRIEQNKLEKGIYLRNSDSIERCSKVVDYYEDIFGTFEWAH